MSRGVLANLPGRVVATWRPLWAQAPRVVEMGYADLQPLSVYLEQGVVPRAGRDDNHNALGANLDSYLRVLPGDIVFNKLRTWQGGLGVSAHEGIVSPAYFICRPVAGVEPRYLHYLLRSNPYLAEMTRLSKWMPPSQFDIPWDALRTLPLLILPLDEQRRIADFLDDQVARLDRAIELRRQQISLATERYLADLTDAYDQAVRASGAVRAGFLLRGLEQGWSPQCEERLAEEGEYGVLKAGCVNGGLFRPEQHKVLPAQEQPRLEYLIAPGDLLVSRASGSLDLIGSAAVVPEGTPPNLILCDKVYRLRLLPDNAPQFMALMMRAQPLREAIRLGTSGAEGMANNIPSATLRGLRIPALPIAAQLRAVADLLEGEERLATATSLLTRSLGLLAERKQSLITAAVTGQFDVTTARSVA